MTKFMVATVPILRNFTYVFCTAALKCIVVIEPHFRQQVSR